MKFPIESGDLRLYEAGDGTWTVADGGGWLPGIYDSRATAEAAARLPYGTLAALSVVCHYDGESRAVTMSDLPRITPPPTPS